MSIKNILKLIPDDLKNSIKTVPERLSNLGNLYHQRGQVYGDSYTTVGVIMSALYPKGLVLSNQEHFNRYNLLSQMVNKIVRYSKNIHENGHKDSLDDLSVYSQMAAYLDEISIAAKNNPQSDDAVYIQQLLEQNKAMSQEILNLQDEVVKAKTAPKAPKPPAKTRKAS